MSERLGIAGSGAIACGLAAVAAQRGDVVVWARSDGSAEKADRRVRALCEKAGAHVNGNVRVTCDGAELAEASFVVEAIVEDPAAKCELVRELGGRLRATRSSPAPPRRSRSPSWPKRPAAPIASSGSTCSTRSRRWSGRARVPARGERADPRARPRAVRGARQDRRSRCRHRRLRGQPPPVPVPVRGRSPDGADGARAGAIDTCMRLGAGHPLGPLAARPRGARRSGGDRTLDRRRGAGGSSG